MNFEQDDLHALIVEVRLLRTEFTYVKDQLIERNAKEAEIYERLRDIEQTLAVLKAAKPVRISGWNIGAVLITALLALITFVEKFGVGGSL